MLRERTFRERVPPDQAEDVHAPKFEERTYVSVSFSFDQPSIVCSG
jgi:hypothetical protein